MSEFRPWKNSEKYIDKGRIRITLFSKRRKATGMFDYRVIMQDLISDKVKADEEFDVKEEALEYMSDLYNNI